MSSDEPAAVGARAALVAPASLAMALALVTALTHTLPEGAGGLDHAVVPAVAFPMVWVACALSLLAAGRRGWIVAVSITIAAAIPTAAEWL